MQVLNLLNNNCHVLNKFSLGEELGNGSDGQVFSIKNFDDKVIKLCVLFDNYDSDDISLKFNKIKEVLNFISYNKPNIVARVYEYDFLLSSTRKVYKGEQNYICYYYIMEKLYKISEDEKKVFHSIISHEDNNIIKNYSQKELENILAGLSKGLDFDAKRITLFYAHLKKCAINHNDLHPRNIMKNKNNEFKLIDFDKCSVKQNNL